MLTVLGIGENCFDIYWSQVWHSTRHWATEVDGASSNLAASGNKIIHSIFQCPSQRIFRDYQVFANPPHHPSPSKESAAMHVFYYDLGAGPDILLREEGIKGVYFRVTAFPDHFIQVFPRLVLAATIGTSCSGD
jgi:hypothetical protein